MIKRIFFFLVICIPVALLFTGTPQNIYKQLTLKLFLENLKSISDTDYSSWYSLLLPEDQAQMSLNEFIEKNTAFEKPYSKESINRSYRIENNYALVEKTIISCWSQSCAGKDRIVQDATTRYIFRNWKWYTTLNSNATFCTKSEPYPMPEEFTRAISLIIQREEKGTEDNRLFAQSLKNIKNCLNINYAQSEDDMFGAEGYFTFNKNSLKNNYMIFVSPKYTIKDDLLTATLLSHELSHADLFAWGFDKEKTCYENEATAFTNQWAFLLLLNQGEKESIAARAYSSDDVHSILYTLQQIQNQKGNNWYEQALNYVQNNDFYIKQCSFR